MRVLIVEDNADLAQRLKADLARAGFAADVVDNGVDGEFMGDQEPYDAVVLDLGLPDRAGLDVLRNWRARDNRVPVLILTARDAWHEKVDGFKAGADDYLGKPFHIEELTARLNALIRRGSGAAGGALCVAGLTLDEDHQTVCAADAAAIELEGGGEEIVDWILSRVELAPRVALHGVVAPLDKPARFDRLGRDILNLLEKNGFTRGVD